jgi:glycosyltransferase involved in cell wall biosynthesis
MISIGLAFYNNEKYLRYAVDSILNQDYVDFELLVIDDGSTDSSKDIILEYKDKRIVKFRNDKRLGLAACMNFLIDRSTRKYFCRMDADDIMMVNRLSLQLDFMETNPDIDVVGSNADIIDESGNCIGKRVAISDLSTLAICTRYGYFVHPTVFGRTIWFKKNKYDIRFLRGQDYELWLRTVNFSKFKNLNESLIFYRVGSKRNYLKKKIFSLRYRIMACRKNLGFFYLFHVVRAYYTLHKKFNQDKKNGK